VQAKKHRDAPAFLPCLLLAPRQQAVIVKRHLGKTADELLWTPIDKDELQTRVTILLRGRQQSLELKQHNDELEALLDARKAVERMKDEFISIASHELRSPLARLKMAVAMIEEAPPEQRERLRREIHANIGELDALVEEVLMASRLDAGAAPLKREPVELLALVAEEASLIDASAEGDSVLVNGDERLLRRALRNLLENARRYGGGRIDVRVRSAAPGSGEVSVCDDGPGVPDAYRDRVFEAFFRLPGHAEQDGGVGLGLALVRQIAQAHGGSVRCSARSGGGSCFVLSLPAA
jgi:signal transduction histidine kinase